MTEKTPRQIVIATVYLEDYERGFNPADAWEALHWMQGHNVSWENMWDAYDYLNEWTVGSEDDYENDEVHIVVDRSELWKETNLL